MSHFSVMVIGPNVDEQLAPYHEFECTGANDQFVQNIDITTDLQGEIDKYLEENPNAYDEALKEALGYYGLEDSVIDDESKADIVGDECEHKYGYAVVKDGKLVKAVDRTNPNKKWDWWVVGGRWRGFLTGKDGKEHNELPKGQIDFEAMRSELATYATNEHDTFTRLVGEHKLMTWQEARNQCKGEDGTENIDAARELYHGQEAMKRIREDKDFYMNHMFGGFDKFLVPREQYIQAARDRACSTYAIVKDGQWYAKGEMGWFGMSSDDMTQDDWNKRTAELLDSLPDDTMITIVDCHI